MHSSDGDDVTPWATNGDTSHDTPTPSIHPDELGCSNLQHNIEFDSVQKNLNFDVDFIYFSASQNSTFLKFLADEGAFDGYKQLVLYLPFQFFKKNVFLKNSEFGFRYYACYDYAANVIKNCPSSLFYDWDGYYDSIHMFRPVNENYSDFLVYKDALMDSLSQNNTSYRNCTEKFIHQKHIHNPMSYIPDDVRFINSLKKGNQKIAIIIGPIPNITEHYDGIKKTNIMKAGFPNIINPPYVMDSSLFYEQWLHLNDCGRKVETNNMINYLRKIKMEE